MALDEMTATIVASSRNWPPFDLNGGGSGRAGKQYVLKYRAKEVVQFSGIDIVALEAGDRITIETPGGGGYGKN